MKQLVKGETMQKGIHLGNRTALMILISSLAASIAWTLACAPPAAPPPPLPPPTSKFSYEPPQQSSRPVAVTLGLVRPIYEPLEGATSPRDWQQWPIVKNFLQAMGGDVQRMLVAKGFTLTGPFDDLNQMTYPDKKTANLTLTPSVFLNVEAKLDPTREDSPGVVSGTGGGTLTVSSWVNFVLLEPLSGEKIWIKKLPLDPVQKRFSYQYRVQRTTEGPRGDRRIVSRVEQFNDNRQHVLAEVLESYYPTIMQTAWQYFHPDEVLALKKMSGEIREKKRF